MASHLAPDVCHGIFIWSPIFSLFSDFPLAFSSHLAVFAAFLQESTPSSSPSTEIGAYDKSLEL